MYCAKCGTKRMDNESAYCINCGSKLYSRSDATLEPQTENDLQFYHIPDNIAYGNHEQKSKEIKRSIAHWMNRLLIPFYIIYRLLFWEKVDHIIYTDYYYFEPGKGFGDLAERRPTGSVPYNHASTLAIIIGIILLIVASSIMFYLIFA